MVRPTEHGILGYELFILVYETSLNLALDPMVRTVLTLGTKRPDIGYESSQIIRIRSSLQIRDNSLLGTDAYKALLYVNVVSRLRMLENSLLVPGSF